MRTRNTSFTDFGVKRFLGRSPEGDREYRDDITDNMDKLSPENARIRDVFNIIRVHNMGRSIS